MIDINSDKKKLNLLENEAATTNFLINKKNKLQNVCDSNNNIKELNNIIHFDQVFDSIKQYGGYQFFMLCVIQYIMLTSVGNYIFMSFGTLRIQCKNTQQLINEDVCITIEKCSKNNTISLFHSLYEEKNFVCPNSQIPLHMQTLQAVGSGIGAILGGHLADYFGRKWVTYSGALIMSFFGICGAFSLNWIFLSISMFGMGLSYGILIDASMTLASETVGPRYRIVQTLAFQWSFVMQVVSLIAYLTGGWRQYLLIINLISLPALILMLFWRESPRWLIQKHRLSDACRELDAISSFNGSPIRFKPEDFKNVQLSSLSKNSCKIYSIWDLLGTKKLISYSIVMFFSALTVEMCVAVIIFDVQMLDGNPFLNIALYGMLRIWVPLFIVFLEAIKSWMGRRMLFILSQLTTVICFTIVILLILFVPKEYQYKNSYCSILRTVLCLIGGVINSSIFFTMYKQYSIELYPTLMRAMAVGTFGVVERIGGGLAPQLITMNNWIWEGSAITITSLIALLSLISGYIVLPETKNTAMPDVHELNINSKVKSNNS